MKISRNQFGFSLLIILGVLLSMGIVGFAGWKVYETNKSSKATDTTAETETATQTETKPTVPEGFVLYENKDLGIKFTHPKVWGTVTAAKKDIGSGGNGHYVTFDFSGETKVKAGLVSKDIEVGADGTCYVFLGVWPEETFLSTKQYIKEGDGENTGDYKTTTHFLKDTNDTLIYENFEAGTSEGLGGCLHASIHGTKLFKHATYGGIEFFWGQKDQDYLVVPVSEFAKYKADPEDYISKADRENFITTVSSADAL